MHALPLNKELATEKLTYGLIYQRELSEEQTTSAAPSIKNQKTLDKARKRLGSFDFGWRFS